MKTLLTALTLALLALPARAAEGMWPLNALPRAALDSHGLQPDRPLLRQASVLLPYGSGSFVSPHGLVLTNHHVVSECIDALSTPARPLQQRGFVAATRAGEMPCPGLELQVLQGIDELVPLPADPQARRAEVARLEGADCPVGERCRVVLLHGGAWVHRYRSRVWNDVRLVMAPENQAANFGGDDDNFQYPRFALDFALLRVYDNGRPLATPHHFRPARRPLREGDGLLVPGHPYRTERGLSLAQLEAQRDAVLPEQLAALDAELAALARYAEPSAEAARQVADLRATLENSRKASRGALDALLRTGPGSPLALKQASEQRVRAAAPSSSPWEAAARSARAQALLAREDTVRQLPAGSLLAQLVDALTLRLERQRPAAQRLAAFDGAAEAALLAALGADLPHYPQLEQARLRQHADRARLLLGSEHPWVQALRDAPASDRWTRGAERLALLQRSDDALAADDDPLLQLALALAPLRADWARHWEAEVVQPLLGASEAMAQTGLAVLGASQAPDANFTLRLSFGRAQGVSTAGYRHAWQTNFGGLFARADAFAQQPPFDLAPRVAAARSRLPSSASLNFIGTADIVGGNSGSPVLNADHEWVGLVFDGNLDSLAGDYVYDESSNRMVAVSQAALRLALTRIYPAAHLAREMGLLR